MPTLPPISEVQAAVKSGKFKTVSDAITSLGGSVPPPTKPASTSTPGLPSISDVQSAMKSGKYKTVQDAVSGLKSNQAAAAEAAPKSTLLRRTQPAKTETIIRAPTPEEQIVNARRFNTDAQNLRTPEETAKMSLGQRAMAVQPSDWLNEIGAKLQGSDWKVAKATGNILRNSFNIVEDFGKKTADAINATVFNKKLVAGKYGALKAEKISGSEKAKAIIDAGVSISNLPAIPFMAGIEAVGVVPVVGEPLKGAFEKVTGGLDHVGRFMVGKAFDAIPDSVVSAHTKDDLRGSVQDLGGIFAVLAGFRAVHSAGGKVKGKVGEIRNANDVVRPMATALGLEPKKTLLGNMKPIDVATLDAAYKGMVEKIAGTDGADVKSQALGTAYRALKDYTERGSKGFADKWLEPAKVVEQNLAGFLQEGEKRSADIARGQSLADASASLKAPAEERKSVLSPKKLDETGQLAFESEMVNAINEAAKKKPGADVNAIPFDERPAYYDPMTSKIMLNPETIGEHVEHVYNGGSILAGEGARMFEFKSKPGESRLDLAKRYVDELYKHEEAHAQTITPTDAARLKAAIDTGDQVGFRKIRQELETRADQYVKRGGETRGFAPEVEKALGTEYERIQKIMDARDQLKNLNFKNTMKTGSSLDEGYKRWKETVRRSPDIARLDYEGLKKHLAETRKDIYGKTGVVEKRFALDLLHEKTGTALNHDELLGMFRDRLTAETKLIEVARQPIQEKLKGLSNEEREIQRSVQREVKQALKEIRQERGVEARKQKAMTTFNDIVTAKEAIPTGREGEARRIAQTENKYKSSIEEVKSRFEAKNVLERAIVRTNFERRVKEIRQEKTQAKEARGLAVDYLKENVPRAFQYKFLSRINQLTSKALDPTARRSLTALMGEMDKEFNRVKRKELARSVVEELKKTVLKRERGILKGKFGGEAQKKLDTIRELVRQPRTEAMQKVLESLTDANRNPETGDLLPGIVERNELLMTAGLKEQTVSQMKRTLETIQSIAETGKTKLQERRAQEQMRNERIVGRIVNTVTGGEKPAASLLGLGRAREFGKTKALFDRYAWQSKPLDFIFDALSRKSKEYKPFESPLNNVARRMQRVKNEASRASEADGEQLSNLMQKAYEVKGLKLAKLWADNTKKKMALGEFVDGRGEKVNLNVTRAEAINIFAQTRNTNSMKLVMERNGFTSDMLAAVEKSLTKQDKAFVDGLFEFYKSKYPEFSAAFEKDTGAPLPFTDQYIPRWGEAVDIADPSVAQLLAGEAADNVGFRPGAAKGRKGGLVRFDYDPFEQARLYSTRVNHYVKGLQTIKDVNAIFRNGKVRDAIGGLYGKNALEFVDHQLDLFRRDGVDRAKVNQTFDRIASRVSRAFINSWSVVGGQFSSNAQFFAEAESSVAFGKGLASYARHPIAATKVMMEHSGEFRSRYKERAGRDIQNEKAKSSFEKLSRIDEAINIAEMPLTAADYFGIAPGGWAVFQERYASLLKQGMGKEKALAGAGKYLDSVILRTQSTSNYLGRSGYETGGTFKRMFSMLQNQPNKAFLVPLHAIQNAWAGKMPMAKALKITAVYAGLMPSLYVMGRTLFSNVEQAAIDAVMPPSEDEKKRRAGNKETLGGKIKNEMLAQPFTSPIIVGSVIKSALERLSGKEYGYRPGVVFSTLDTALSGLSQISAGDYDEAALYGLKVLTQLGGVPFAQKPIQSTITSRGSANTARKAGERAAANKKGFSPPKLSIGKIKK